MSLPTPGAPAGLGPRERRWLILFLILGSGYFGTVGMRLLSGRDFSRSDIEGGPKVAIVNEAFAKKFGLGRDAVGKRMATENEDYCSPYCENAAKVGETEIRCSCGHPGCR